MSFKQLEQADFSEKLLQLMNKLRMLKTLNLERTCLKVNCRAKKYPIYLYFSRQKCC